MNVDVVRELEQFEWSRARWTSTRLLASSPFRSDRHPSFFVNIDPESEFYGCWGDSGAIDDEWRSGDFPKLLAYLRGESIESTLEYLDAMYGDSPKQDAPETIRPPRLTSNHTNRKLSLSTIDDYSTVDGTHSYLTSRGIDPRVQRLMRIGYDRRNKAVVIPWFNADGTLGNVLYRKIRGKSFWYHTGGRPISQMIYGIDVVYKRKIKRAAIVEAPIDAMSIMTAGMMAIATGGTAISQRKIEMIRKSPIDEIVIVRDNDDAGKAWRRKLVQELSGHLTISIAAIPRGHKDANDVIKSGRGDILTKRLKKSRKIYEIMSQNASVKHL